MEGGIAQYRYFLYLAALLSVFCYAYFSKSFVGLSELGKYTFVSVPTHEYLHWQKKTNTQDQYHIALTLCGKSHERYLETVAAIKSVLLFQSSRLVHFHVFATENMQLQLKYWLTGIPHVISKRFLLSAYHPHFPEPSWENMFALCSTQRLFIADKLANISEVLYMDTDSLLVSPLDEVWKEFRNFTKDQMIGMTYNQIFHKGWYDDHAIPHLPPHGYNAGILLMDVAKVRKLNWVANLTRIMHQQMAEKSNVLGDQDILNEYFYYFPELLYIMPCTLNFRSDYCVVQNVSGHTVSQSCLDAESQGALILHASRHIEHRETPNVFATLYEAVLQYDLAGDFWVNFLQPLLKRIEDLAKKDDRFKKSHCFFVRHLIVRNFIRYASQQYNSADVTETLLENMASSKPTGLFPDCAFYVKQMNYTFNPQTRNRHYPETALAPLQDLGPNNP